MNLLESPARKLLKQNDYRRHKLFRKIKRRNRAEAELAMNAATKALQKKLKKPSFADGKDVFDEGYDGTTLFNNSAEVSRAGILGILKIAKEMVVNDGLLGIINAYNILRGNPKAASDNLKRRMKSNNFNGAGAGGSWGYDNNSAPRDTTFNDAYDRAVDANLEYFMFGGKKYNTKKENNPLREVNNRVVGTGRMASRMRGVSGYPTEWGPYVGPMSGIPMVTDTYTKKKKKWKK